MFSKLIVLDVDGRMKKSYEGGLEYGMRHLTSGFVGPHYHVFILKPSSQMLVISIVTDLCMPQLP